MSFRYVLRSILAALLGAAATATALAQQPEVIPTGNWPVSVSTGDSNPQDGIADLLYCDPAVAGVSTGCHLLRGTGHGGFSKVEDYNVGTDTGSFFTAAVANLSGTLHHVVTLSTWNAMPKQVNLAIQIGMGGFQDTTFQLSGPLDPIPGQIQFIRYDNSSTPQSATNSGFLFEDIANGTLYSAPVLVAPLIATLPNAGSGSFITGDFDGDGRTDILVSGTTNNAINFYHGNGDGTFTVVAQTTLPSGIFSMLVADIDGDSIPDLIVEGANGALFYFQGSTTGFSTTALSIAGTQDGTIGQGGHLVAIADLNNDGIPDIITSTPAGIGVLLGQPPLNSHIPFTPRYKLGGIYNAGPGRGSYALADFNNDGHPDLAVDSPEGIAILYGNADGSFQTSRSYASAKPADGIALGNFTGSGNVDVLVANEAPRILAGDGQGGFTLMPDAIPVPSYDQELFAVAAGDFDGDGKLDAAFIPQGSFLPPPLPPPPPPPPGSGQGPICGCFTSITIGPDAYIDKGTGTGQFSSLTNPMYSGITSAALPLDANGDGTAELANFSYAGCAVEFGLPGAGTPAFTETQLFSDTNMISLAPGPYSGSFLGAVGYLQTGRTGKQDIVCQNLTAIHVFRNNGDGTYTQTASFPNPSNYAVIGSDDILPTTGILTSAILLQDLDGDGNGDIIVVYPNLNTTASPSGSVVYIYWGNGDGTFSAPQILGPSRNNYLAAVADADNDGHPDLILSDGYLLTVFAGQGTERTFGAEQHYLAGMGINAIATTPNGHTTLIAANGGTAISNPIANRGIFTFNTGLATGGITVLAISHLPGTTGALTATPSNPGYGDIFTLTTTINTVAGVTPTGAVNFSVDGAVAATGISLINGVATYAVTAPTYAVGTHTLTAVYSGDSNYAATTLTSSLDVTLLDTVTTITTVVTPIYYGQVIADTAIGMVVPADSTASASLLGGTLTFFIDGVDVCVLPVNGTQERCPDPTGAGYPAGNHTISSTYSGNAFYTQSRSPIYPVQILPDVVSQGVLTTSGTPATVGVPVTFTAVFPAPFATPTGAVTFLDGSTVIGSGPLDTSGTAHFTTSSLGIGTHTITATYAGNINFDTASSNLLQQTILPAPLGTLTTLRSSINPSTLGQTVTFTATVIFNPIRLGTPIGVIGFTIDGVDVPGVPSSTQASASATYSTSTLAPGNHNIVAFFVAAIGTSSPTSNSTSPTLVQVVDAAPPPPSFTLTINPAAISVPIGNAVSVLVTVTPVGGFNQPVTLSCGTLPREVTCAFAADTFASGNGSTFLFVSAMAPHNCGTTQPYFISSGPNTWFGLLATSGLMLLLRRRRRLVKGIVLTLALCILPMLSGCGNCTDLGVEPGSYTFTVTGASTGASPVTVAQTIPMAAHL